MKHIIFFILLFSFLFSCVSNEVSDSKIITNDSISIIIDSNKVEETNVEDKSNFEKLEIIKGIGVLVLVNSGDYLYKSNDTSFLLNTDGSIYLAFNFNRDFLIIEDKKTSLFDSDILTINKLLNIKFEPLFFDPETGGVIEFYCNGIKDGFFEVFINDTNLCYISTKDSIFKFYSWEKYISRQMITVNLAQNPIRNFPSDTSTVAYGKNTYVCLEVESISGNWIKVKCDQMCMTCDNKYYGWLKWKNEKNELLVNFSSSI